MAGLPYNTIDRVDANVFISGYKAAANPNIVRKLGITRILKMFADDPSYPGGYHRHPGVKYMIVSAEDVPEYDIRQHFPAAARFVRDALAHNEKILIHCHAGISRSSTIVILHLMINRGMDLQTALRYLSSIRSIIRPNDGFMQSLVAVDALLGRTRGARAPVRRARLFWKDMDWRRGVFRYASPLDPSGATSVTITLTSGGR